jgi:hypothetical protein
MNLQRIAKLLENKEQVVRETVLDNAQKKNQIVYGSRAFNFQAPDYLKKKTSDYDILTNRPKKSAKEVAEILSRRLGKKVTIRPASHKGTYKVIVDGEPLIDYTQKRFKPETKSSWGVQVRSLKSIKRNAKRLSNKKGLEYRKNKDLDTLKRIQEIEDKYNF